MAEFNSTFTTPGYVPVKKDGRQGQRFPRRNQRFRVIRYFNNKGARRNFNSGQPFNFKAKYNVNVARKGGDNIGRKGFVLRKFNRNFPNRNSGQNNFRSRRRGARFNRKPRWNSRFNRNNDNREKVTKEQLDMDIDEYMGNDETVKSKLDNQLDNYFKDTN